MKKKVCNKILSDTQLRRFISLVYPHFIKLIGNERIAGMIMMYCNGDSIQLIGLKYDLSSERVRQLINKGVRIVMSIFLRQQLLYEKIDTLGNIIQAKDDKIMNLIQDLKSFHEIKDHDKPNEIHRIEEIYSVVSVRLRNVLRSLDIIFLEDLCQFSKSDLMTYRNFGRKSFLELESLLKKYNLTLRH